MQLICFKPLDSMINCCGCVLYLSELSWYEFFLHGFQIYSDSEVHGDPIPPWRPLDASCNVFYYVCFGKEVSFQPIGWSLTFSHIVVFNVRLKKKKMFRFIYENILKTSRGRSSALSVKLYSLKTVNWIMDDLILRSTQGLTRFDFRHFRDSGRWSF